MKPPVRPRDPFAAAPPRPAETVASKETTPADLRQARVAAIGAAAQRRVTPPAPKETHVAEIERTVPPVRQDAAAPAAAQQGEGLEGGQPDRPRPADDARAQVRPEAEHGAAAAAPGVDVDSKLTPPPRDLRVAAQLRALAEALVALAAALEAP